jgi:hypothetical protein
VNKCIILNILINVFYIRTIFNSRWDNNRKQFVNNSSSRTLNEFNNNIMVNAKAGILPGGNNCQSVHKNSCYINAIDQCDNNNNKVIENKSQCINDVNNAKCDYDLQVHTAVCTTNSAGAQRDSRSAAGDSASDGPSSQAVGSVSGCAHDDNITDYDILDYDKITAFGTGGGGEQLGINKYTLFGNRGLSMDDGAQGLPHNRITDLGNLDHTHSGDSLDTPYKANDWLVTGVFKQLKECDIQDHFEFIDGLDSHQTYDYDLGDLENHRGDLKGCSYPPPHVPILCNALDREYGFIPLDETQIFQGPVSQASVDMLWG